MYRKNNLILFFSSKDKNNKINIKISIFPETNKSKLAPLK